MESRIFVQRRPLVADVNVLFDLSLASLYTDGGIFYSRVQPVLTSERAEKLPLSQLRQYSHPHCTHCKLYLIVVWRIKDV